MYEQKVRLKDSEKALAIDQQTGNVRDLSTAKPRNENVERFDMPRFLKHNVEAWELLAKMCNKNEYAIAVRLSHKIRMITNSLEPFNDETSVRELSHEFGISIGKVKSVFDKLFTLGVYGRFEVSEWKDQEFKHKKYWVFNPYLSVNGGNIDKRTRSLFDNTLFGRMFPAPRPTDIALTDALKAAAKRA